MAVSVGFLLLLNGETAACRLNPVALCCRPPDRHRLVPGPILTSELPNEMGAHHTTNVVGFTLHLALSEARLVR